MHRALWKQSRKPPREDYRYGTWREGAHDDLVLATARARWIAERDVARWAFV